MVPRMKELAHGIIASIPILAHTGGLFFLVFLVCGIVGLKLFDGAYRGTNFSSSTRVALFS